MRVALFKKRIKNKINLNDQNVQLDDVLLSALLNNEKITRDKALTLPSVSGAVDFISGSIASMPVKLYKYKNGKVEEVQRDSRVRMLNGDTGNTLDGFQTKKAMVEDYLLGKGGYCFIQRDRQNNVTALKYIPDMNVTVWSNSDPMNRFVQFYVGANKIYPWNMIKLLRNTKDGASGKGLTEEISKALETAYSTLVYQLGLVKTGGNKKGFLQAERRLGQEEIDREKLKHQGRTAHNQNIKAHRCGNHLVPAHSAQRHQEAQRQGDQQRHTEDRQRGAKAIEQLIEQLQQPLRIIEVLHGGSSSFRWGRSSGTPLERQQWKGRLRKAAPDKS